MKFGKGIQHFLEQERTVREDAVNQQSKKKRPDKREREEQKIKQNQHDDDDGSAELKDKNIQDDATKNAKKRKRGNQQSKKSNEKRATTHDKPKFRKVKKSYSIRTGVKDDIDGEHKEHRQKFVEIHEKFPDTKQFYELKTKKRNVWRLKKRYEDALIFEVDDEFTPCRVGPNKKESRGVFYKDDTTRKLKRSQDPDVSKKFGWFDVRSVLEELKIVDDSNIDYLKTLSDELNMMDDGFRLEDKDIIFLTKSGNIVFIKLSRRHRSIIDHKEWTKEHAETLLAATRIGRTNGRGKDKGGPAAKYITLGLKKEEKGCYVNEFEVDHDFVPEKFETQEEEVAWMKARLWNLFWRLQEIGLQLVPDFDLSVFNKLREEEGLGKGCVDGDSNGFFTGMAIATEYWSPLHIDNDLFYTILSCYCSSMVKKDGFKENILFYFCFPSIKFAVPMRHTDVLLFNSAFPHCASNYRYKDCMTFSLFASAATIYSGMKMHKDTVNGTISEKENKKNKVPEQKKKKRRRRRY